jgi:glycine betaine/proline transport system ATP-binding protein
MAGTDSSGFTADSEAAIEVKNLWKVYGHNPRQAVTPEQRFVNKEELRQKTGNTIALRDVSFSVNRGEVFVVMGLSESGKSTLVRCIMRLIEPTAGKVFINGEDIGGYSRRQLTDFLRYTAGMASRKPGLFPHRNMLDNVAYGLKVRGLDREKRYQRARASMARMGLMGTDNLFPYQLSADLQRRAALAKVLANDPDILFLDEPFGMLEPLVRHRLQDELLLLQAELQKTILLTTDDLDEGLKLGNRIGIIREGEIIQVGTPEEIISSPGNANVWEYVQQASPARVVSARSIMEQPGVLLYEWQGPRVALHILKTMNLDEAFVLSRTGNLMGLVTTERLVELIQKQGEALMEAIEPEVPVCTPDMVLEDLIPLAVSTRHPVPVVNERGRFLGEISTSSILFSMIQQTQAEE